jgi:tetratricopeptide (TPR) repeat protein
VPAVACLVAAALIAYLPTLRSGFIWDDDSYIQNNIQLRSRRGLQNIWMQAGSVLSFIWYNQHPQPGVDLDRLWLRATAEPQYYPLTHTSLWLEYHLWGQSPLGYHLDNLLLHILSSLLLWRLLLRLQIPGAFAVALLFAVHPLQAESVAWATERKNVLSGLLYFCSLWGYLRFLNFPPLLVLRERAGVRAHFPNAAADPHPDPLPEYQERGQKRWLWYFASLLLFVMALLSKSVTATLPMAVLVILWWRRGRITMRDLWPLLPMFAAGMAMGSLTGWMEKHVVGAVGLAFDWLTPLDRICIAGRALWFYLFKLIWPAKLMFIYPHWRIDPQARPWLLLFPISAAVGLLALWLLRRRIGRGPLAALLFYAITLFPALGFVNVFPMRYSFVADHFAYLAIIGPLALIAATLSRHLSARPGGALLAVVALGLCLLSNLQTRIFHDSQTLWSDTLAKNPDSPMAHANYADVLRDIGDLHGAQIQYERAMQLRDDATDLIGVGQCYFISGDYATALHWYRAAAAAMTDSPERVLHQFRTRAYFQIGAAYSALADQAADSAQAAAYRQQAVEAYQQAIEIYPLNVDAISNLADLFLFQGEVPQAIDACRQALDIDPDCVPALTNLGNALLAQGRFDEATAQYVRVLEIEPLNANAFNDIGVVLMKQGRYAQAIEQFEVALSIDPHFAKAHANLLAAGALRAEHAR